VRALTIHAPWAWAILAGHKPIESRRWGYNHRGPLAIHAGLSKRSDVVARELFDRLSIDAPVDWAPYRGRLLGAVRLVDCEWLRFEAAERDPWAPGPCMAWRLDRPTWLEEPIPMQGRLGLWDLYQLGRIDAMALVRLRAAVMGERPLPMG
jgi:hypothetical protein